MTRSVEIPDETVQRARKAWMRMFASGPTSDPLMPMRAALEAALPYLAPAGDGGLREALKKLVAEWSERATGYDEYSELRALLATHPAAPAVPQPAADSGHNHLPRCCCPTWQVAPDDHDYESRGGRIEREACPGCPEHGAPAAVPQPVDREALWEAVVKVRDAAPRVPDDADSWDIVDAVLALLAGEQEQGGTQ